MPRTKRLTFAAAGVAVLAVAAVTGVAVILPASADQPAAPAAGAAIQAVPAVATTPLTPGKARGATAVDFDPAALEALAPLNPIALRPGSLAPTGPEGDVVAVFPIVGTTASGVVSHTGGLLLSTDAARVRLVNYEINSAQGVLTAQAFLDGRALGRVPFLQLGAADDQPSCEATATLTLSSAAAFLLSDAFGVGDLTGATIGTACVDLR